MEYWFVLCLVAFCGTIIWLTERSRKERQQLYNRLMARDLADYRQMLEKPKPPRENFLAKQMRKGYDLEDDTDD